MAAPQPVAENYAQPALPTTKSGWAINCLDYQILTKSDGWNQSQAARLNEFQEAVNVGGINYVALAFPSCKIMIGEWGFHTVTDYGEGVQYGTYDRVCTALRNKSFVIGVNFWNHLGQTQSSLWTDASGTIIKGGRKAVNALRLAFNAGNKTFGWRVRI